MVQVTLGDYVLGQDIEPLEPQKFGVVDIKVHPKFKYTPQVRNAFEEDSRGQL
jgi:hypothetical protein